MKLVAFRFLLPILVLSALASSGVALAAWREPNCNPFSNPASCNTPEPINRGADPQEKLGPLQLGALSVLGNFRIPANAGAGKVLTSDSLGYATWQWPSGGSGGGAGPGGSDGDDGPPGPPGDNFWQAISNGIRYMGGNVGIRSNPGNDQLFINGTTRVQGDFFLGSFAQPALHTASGNLHINPASSGGYSNVILNRNNNGSVGIRKDPSSAYSLDVAGGINATRLCINGDCRTSWSGVSGSSGDSFPAGSIVMSLGACPAGWLHDARFNTRFPVGGDPGRVIGAQSGDFPSHTSGTGQIGGVQLSFITPLIAPILTPTFREEIPSVSVHFCVKQ